MRQLLLNAEAERLQRSRKSKKYRMAGSMEEFVRKSLLFDFYGELLTERQKEVYRKYHAEDLSLGEIAEEYEVSRQAVHDLLKRCDKQLESYEARLQLLQRFAGQKEKILRIQAIAGQEETDAMRQIARLTGEILAEL